MYEISIPRLDGNVSCTAQLDGVEDVTFHCLSLRNPNVRNVQCDNETFNATYAFQFDGVSNFVLYCMSDEQLLFNKSLPISIVPSLIAISHTTFTKDQGQLTLHFSKLENVEGIVFLEVQQLDGDGSRVGQVFKIANQTLVQNSPSIAINHTFEGNRMYVLKMKFQNGDYQTEIVQEIVTAVVTLTSTKKLHQNPNTDKFDALFNLTMSSVSFSSQVVAYYSWFILGENHTTTDNLITRKFPLQTACYDVDLNITSVNITTAIATTNVCLQTGINVTLDYIKGIKLGDVSTLTLIVDQIGPDSCLLLEVVNSNQSVLFLKDGSTNSTYNSCTNRGLTAGREVTNRYLYNDTLTNLLTGTYDFLFTTEGQFQVKMVAENEVTLQTETAVVDVININCRSPEIEIIGMSYLFVQCSSFISYLYLVFFLKLKTNESLLQRQ